MVWCGVVWCGVECEYDDVIALIIFYILYTLAVFFQIYLHLTIADTCNTSL